MSDERGRVILANCVKADGTTVLRKIRGGSYNDTIREFNRLFAMLQDGQPMKAGNLHIIELAYQYADDPIVRNVPSRNLTICCKATGRTEKESASDRRYFREHGETRSAAAGREYRRWNGRW